MTPLPVRPRLAEHALVRRHVVDGAEIVVIHDARSGNLVRMGPREWLLVEGADGTRDFDALALAAARRGAFRRASELRGALDALHAAGLLADGIAHPALEEPSDPSRPLDVLPGFSLTCDRHGGCCATYGSVLFTPREAVIARAIAPDTMDGADDEARAFTPARGATRDGALAVALVDGRCAYLAGDGRCGLHVLGGERAKPRGCRTYPATFVDDGEAVRVSVGVECPCVLASVVRAGGEPLVPEGARTRGDLEPGTRVVTLAESIALDGTTTVPRAAFSAWSSAVVEELSTIARADGVAILGSLAAAVEAHGLDLDAMHEAIRARPEPAPLGTWIAPPPDDIAPVLAAFAAKAKAKAETARAWRGATDRTRLASGWIAEAAERLGDPATLADALASPSVRTSELFFLRSQLHGRLLVSEGPLVDALRDRAARLLLARVLPASLPEGDPAYMHPIALVEAMMRGHGVATRA